MYLAPIETLGFPFLPCLVVTSTTPFAPRAPYMEVAEASFKISIDSISLGLILVKGLRAGFFKVPVLNVFASLITGTPSITYKGSLFPLIELVPLIRIEVPAPG